MGLPDLIHRLQSPQDASYKIIPHGWVTIFMLEVRLRPASRAPPQPPQIEPEPVPAIADNRMTLRREYEARRSQARATTEACPESPGPGSPMIEGRLADCLRRRPRQPSSGLVSRTPRPRPSATCSPFHPPD